MMLTFVPGVPGAAGTAARLTAWPAAALLGSLPMLISLTTSVPICIWPCCGPTCCPAAAPAGVAALPWLQSLSNGSSSSRSARSRPCLSSPDKSAVQLPSWRQETQHNNKPQSLSGERTMSSTHMERKRRHCLQCRTEHTGVCHSLQQPLMPTCNSELLSQRYTVSLWLARYLQKPRWASAAACMGS